MNHSASPVSRPTKRDQRARAGTTNAELTSSAATRTVRARTEAEDRTAVFWNLKKRDIQRDPKGALQSLLLRIRECSPIRLYDAIEQGVPTDVVLLLAGALGHTAASVMNLIGVSETTFRRKEEANEPLPEVAGHRAMGFLRIVATLARLLDESGDPELMADFDLEGWVSEWIANPLLELDGKTPAEMLRNPEGHRAVEDLLGRMRGGLPA